MNKKKTIVIFSITLMLILAGILCFSMFKTTYTLNIPNSNEIKSISLSRDDMVEEISAVKEVEEIIYVLNGYERTTQKESVNETPVNVQHPIKVEFNFKKEGTATIYLYENANRHYLEQPYNGIYQISGDEYNSVAKFLQKND